MRNLVLYCFLFLIAISTLEAQDNLEAIERLKTTKSKEKITKYLVGLWVFDSMKTPSEAPIDTRPSTVVYRFNKDMTYSTGKDIASTDSTDGKWHYDEEGKEVRLIYDKPFYPVSSDMPKDYVQSLIESGTISLIKVGFIEIAELTDKKLVIIQHLPHSENELRYNYAIYRKLK